MADVRADLRRRAGDVDISGQGINIVPEAVYVLEVNNIRIFKGFKSPQQGLIEYTVVECHKTQPDAHYEKPYAKDFDGKPVPGTVGGSQPNQPGTSCSTPYDLREDYLYGLFVANIAAIVGEDPKEMLKPDPKTEALGYEEFVQFEGSKEPSLCKGLRVKLTTWNKPNKDRSKWISGTRWETMPAPEGHPLAEFINGKK